MGGFVPEINGRICAPWLKVVGVNRYLFSENASKDEVGRGKRIGVAQPAKSDRFGGPRTNSPNRQKRFFEVIGILG
jgi:hypothetical protein